jgi:hypothetical protein
MTLETSLIAFEGAGVAIPPHVGNAFDVISAARNSRGKVQDAPSELASALIAGDLTAANFDDLLRDSLVRQLTSQTGPNGAAAWAAALAVEEAAENQVRGFLAQSFEDVLSAFGEEFDRQAKILTEALPSGSPSGRLDSGDRSRRTEGTRRLREGQRSRREPLRDRRSAPRDRG